MFSAFSRRLLTRNRQQHLYNQGIAALEPYFIKGKVHFIGENYEALDNFIHSTIIPHLQNASSLTPYSNLIRSTRILTQRSDG